MNAKKYILRKIGRCTCELEPYSDADKSVSAETELYVPSWEDLFRLRPMSDSVQYPVVPQYKDAIVWRIEDEEHHPVWGKWVREIFKVREALEAEQEKYLHNTKAWRSWIIEKYANCDAGCWFRINWSFDYMKLIAPDGTLLSPIAPAAYCPGVNQIHNKAVVKIPAGTVLLPYGYMLMKLLPPVRVADVLAIVVKKGDEKR